MSTSWFQFEDGGSYVGEVDPVGGTAHGFGVARGHDGRAEFAGSWSSGFEESGTFRSSSSSDSYEGEWLEGKRNGLGVERRGHWLYRGEWTDGLKGRYGVRQSDLTSAKYEGTWDNGLQDGYGIETSADGGTYQGQWSSGLRHGHGIRQSATHEMALVTREAFKSRTDASKSSSNDSALPAAGYRVAATAAVSRNTELDFSLRKHDRKSESGGGFVLTEDVAFDGSHRRFGHLLDRLGFRRPGHRRSISEAPPQEGGELKEEFRSLQNQSFQVRPSHEALNIEAGIRKVMVDDDELSLCVRKDVLEGGLIERYFGEWKRDVRAGYGVCHRSDGLQYEGEWLNDKKNGYGRTTLQDGSRLEGKYKNNILVSSAVKTGKGPKLFKDNILEKVENAVREAQKSLENAKQKADIAHIRVPSAQVKAEEADIAAKEATRNEERARFQTSQTNQLNPKPGDHLTMHRISEEEFLVAYDAGEGPPVAGASKRHTGLSSLGLRLPLNLRSKQQEPDQGFAGRKTPQHKLFPWQETKPMGTTIDERRKMEEQVGATEVVGSRHSNQFQQPVEWGMDGRRDIRPGAVAHHSLSRATGGGLHFESRVTERNMAPQLQSMTPTRPVWPGTEGGVGADGKGRRDLLRKELIEAVEPADARHPRRNSLPSIVKEKVFDSSAKSHPICSPSVAVTKPLSTPKVEEPRKRKTLHEPPPRLSIPPPPPAPSRTETYLIDRGVRKRVKNLYEDVENIQRSPSSRQTQRMPSFRSPAMGAMGQLFMSTMVTGFALSQSTPLRDWTQDSTPFRKMYSLESPTPHRKTKTGSTSDVSKIKPSEVLSREVVYVMSQRKREELIRKRAEDEARRMRGEIVISIAMFQDWRILLTVLFLLAIAGLVVMLKKSNHS